MNSDVSVRNETGRFMASSFEARRRQLAPQDDGVGGDLSPQAGRGKKESHRALQRFGEIGFFPREPALIVRGAAKMTVGRGPRVDRAVEVEMLADATRVEVHS